MEFQRIFDNPVFGDHSPLVLGWTDDQLRPVVERLDPWLPDGLTDKWKLAIASCALSVVAEKKLTGRGVHYARRRGAYQIPKRYRCGDPHFTWHFVTGSMDHLQRSGLITHALGYWSRIDGRGRQSVAWATDDLTRLVGPLVDVRAQRGLPTRDETIVLRDQEDKRDINYEETRETAAMRAEVETINDALAQLDLYHGGEKCEIPLGRRVFNGSLTVGGGSTAMATRSRTCPNRTGGRWSWSSTVRRIPWSRSTTATCTSPWPTPRRNSGCLQEISTPSRGSTEA